MRVLDQFRLRIADGSVMRLYCNSCHDPVAEWVGSPIPLERVIYRATDHATTTGHGR
ncbi:hypothetical protein [Mycolicibacterium conceptionense]|uniref:hypothetical protein n=1 Tax=Mycolicibacterium conceptionense TaxID=451644 RepID=UPI000B047BFE|nr:hypothetical protein [Mycolicibacterium conceptionense]